MCFCQDISQGKRDAASLTTGELKDAIKIDIEILDVAIGQLALICQESPLSAADADLEYDQARDLVLVTALMAALYVRELVSRPAQPSVHVQTQFSVN